MTTVETYLREHGPILSGELIQILAEEGVSTDAIRKRISRLRPPISKLKGFFKDNQSFFYLQEQYLKQEFYEGIKIAFKTSAKKYYSIIKSIEYHNGFIRKEHLASYSVSPIKNLKSHKNISNVIEDLKNLNIIYEDDDCYKLNDLISERPNNNFRYYKGVELAKEIILSQFYDCSRSIGLVSYESGKFHSEFSKFQFNFVAPSYIAGILKYNKKNPKPIPAFILADVLIGSKTGIEEVDFFINKIDIIKTQIQSNFIPYLIVENLSQDALKALKSKGIVIGFVNKLFGAGYEELLKSLINIVTNAGAILKNNPKDYLKLISQLKKLVDGKTNNLRGDLFEMAVGYYHSNLCQSLDIGKIFIYEGNKREIDVLAFYQQNVTVCECKAYKSKIDKQIVENWLTSKIPIIYNWLKEKDNDKEVIFEFWSVSGFTSDAEQLLSQNKENIKKYKIEFYDEEKILKKAKQSKTQKIVEIMREYFINNA
jgi:hypothetical protein